MTVEGISAVVAAVVSTAGSVAGLGWWLSWQFQKNRNHSYRILTEHEKLDQGRHEANLQKFNEISVRLARIGNGGEPAPRGRGMIK